MACGILVPRPGIKHVPPAVKVWSPNHWTAREFPVQFNKRQEIKMPSVPTVSLPWLSWEPSEKKTPVFSQKEEKKVKSKAPHLTSQWTERKCWPSKPSGPRPTVVPLRSLSVFT